MEAEKKITKSFRNFIEIDINGVTLQSHNKETQIYYVKN